MQPRKRFGQHFLCDKSIINQIVTTLAPHPKDHLVEIGPGQGALTIPVLQIVKKLEVIEIDRDLIPILKKRTKSVGELSIYSTDVLKFDFSELKKDDRLLRIFGNLPYNIATPLIFHLLTYGSIVSDFLFMLQKEVAKRMVAQVNSAEYGRLSVMLQYQCKIESLFNVPAKAFYPPPNVQSSMVKMIPYKIPPYPAHDVGVFQAIVREAFGHRRKTLRNSLKNIIDDDHWIHLQIPSDLRAENLSVKDFVELANAISEKKLDKM